MSETNCVFIFNQYYLDFLKQLKQVAKSAKDKDSDARKILRSIKSHYERFDKLTEEHRTAYFTEMGAFYEAIGKATSDDEWKAFFKLDDYKEISVFKGISFESVKKYVPLMYVYQYVDLLSLYQKDLSKEVLEVLVPFVKGIAEYKTEDDLVVAIESKEIPIELKNTLKRMWRLAHTPAKMSLNELGLGEIEHTSIGKLAKEIVDEVNLDEIKNELGNNPMDMMSALTNNNGIGKIVASVGSKIQNKLMSGEINQEMLLQDALSLATKLPAMMGGMVPGGGTSSSQGLGDLSGMMSMIQQMASNFGGGGVGGGGVSSDSARRRARLRSKLDKRKKNSS